MTMTNQNFTMYAGDTKNILIPVTNDRGAAVNLTGATYRWVLKKALQSSTNTLEKSDSVTNANNIEFNLAPSDTEGLLGNYYHECELTDQLGNVSTILTGTATFKKSGI